jgi:hypothetical protein
MASKRRLVLMAVIVAVAAVAVSIRRAVRDPKPTPTSAYVQIPSAHLAPAQVQRPASREPAPAADVTHPLQASTEIEQRVFRFETAFLARLSRLSPEAALAELDRVLARPAGAPADRLTDERLERVLAAAYLAWCVSRQPSLLEAARGVARSRAEAEADPMVRQQLVWILAGTKLGPVSVEVEDRDGNARTIEAFSPRDDSGAAWARALLDVAKPFDASLLRWLAERAENPKEKAGAAAFHALLAGGGDDARRTALELFARHPWLRPSAVPALAKNAPVDVLGAFVAVLPATKDSLSVRAMCRALETSAVVPARSGAALLDTYQAQGVEPTGEGPRTRDGRRARGRADLGRRRRR